MRVLEKHLRAVLPGECFLLGKLYMQKKYSPQLLKFKAEMEGRMMEEEEEGLLMEEEVYEFPEGKTIVV